MSKAEKAAARETGEGASGRAGPSTGRDKGLYWILAGIVVTGIAAGYSWIRSVSRR